ncbi:unnamed protein product [Protopolystoma xenopodis]|uniref:Uncharacterized protein n=1 Tax=Protopolystoma xenopodis TaxID=117903 RepID=A0A448XI44_9PLAT|nr:unnamed protein product [Protopolystoma xenopodis]
MNFVNEFQAATELVMREAQALSDSAVHQMQQAVQTPTAKRIALNIDVNAPVIFMPQHSTSPNALMFDLGHLGISNSFIVSEFPLSGSSFCSVKSIQTKLVDSVSVMVERIDVKLEDLRLSRGTVTELYVNYGGRIRCRIRFEKK